MIGYFKFKRENIVNSIKNSPKTQDGYYFYKKFPEQNSKPGKIDGFNDKKYRYPRTLFKNKMCFDDKEIEIYLTEINNENFDIDKMIKRDQHLFETISDFLEYNLFDKIQNYDFNLCELIDTCIYMFNLKN